MMSRSGSRPPVSRPGSFWPHPVVAGLFFIGAGLATSFLKSMYEWDMVALAAGAATGAWMVAALSATRSATLRWIGYAGWAALVAFYALCIYLAVVFGTLLAWTLPIWQWAVVVLASLAAVATAWRPRDRVRVPLVLPLGMWIAALLSGWLREENLVRCDDLLALRAPVQLVVPNAHITACRMGEVRPSGRFARTVWEAPEGGRVVFTTQGTPVAGGIDGSVCEARLDAATPPVCIGPPVNKSQGLIDVPDAQRLLAMQWGLQTPSGSRGGVIFELPRREGIAILGEHWFDEAVGDGFYEPRNSTLYMFSDRRNAIYRAVLPKFDPAPPLPIEFAVGELHYDPETGEGVACGAGAGAAIRGEPFGFRYFIDRNSALLDRLSMSWGCDWDKSRRTVYSTIPNLGLLDRIDYDTGRVEKRWFVGPGMRSVAYDRVRQRVYFNDFLRGYVLAFDETSERVVARWFVGRFSRWVHLTRDERALLVSSNLGIVRIPIDDR
jgi:hypothetical protein